MYNCFLGRKTACLSHSSPVSRFTETDRNGPKRTTADQNGPKRTYENTETDFEEYRTARQGWAGTYFVPTTYIPRVRVPYGYLPSNLPTNIQSYTYPPTYT